MQYKSIDLSFDLKAALGHIPSGFVQGIHFHNKKNARPLNFDL